MASRMLILALVLASSARIGAQIMCSDMMATECTSKYVTAYKCKVSMFPGVMNDPCSMYINGSTPDCLAEACMTPPMIAETMGFCAPACHSASMTMNGMCEVACMTPDCGLDGGDCLSGMVTRSDAKSFVMMYDGGDMNMMINYTEFQAAMMMQPSEMMKFPTDMDEAFFMEYGKMGSFDESDLLVLMLLNYANNTVSHMDMGKSAAVYVGFADSNKDGVVSLDEAMMSYGIGEKYYNSWGGWTVMGMKDKLDDIDDVLYGGAGEFDQMGESDAETLVHLMDMNGDGMVSRLEAALMDMSEDDFAWMDTNMDNMLSADEVADFFELLGTKTCEGTRVLERRHGSIDTKAPLMSGECKWVIKPDWFYKKPEWVGETYMVEGLRSKKSPMNTLRSLKGNTARRNREHAAREDSLTKTRTVTGQAAAFGEADFVVRFSYSSQSCSGALVHPNWVVTSASCIQHLESIVPNKDLLMISVEVGATTPGSGEMNTIADWFVHPGYESDGSMDIGLIKLASPSAKKCAVLYDGGDLGITDCYKLTMGFMAWNTSTMAYNRVPMRLVDQDDCEEAYELVSGEDMIGHEDMCVRATEFAEGMGPECMADLGGPLVARVPTHPEHPNDVFLVGLSNIGLNCFGTASTPLPGVFTRISPLLSWIYSVDPTLGVHPAQMMKITIDSLGLPPGGTLEIYKGATTSGVPTILDSKCQVPQTIMDDGAGALTLVYKMPERMPGIDCDEDCAKSMGFSAKYETEECDDVPMETCNMVAGCGLLMDGQEQECMQDSPCTMSLDWQHIGPMEDTGMAFTGGLGKQAKRTAMADYGVWACVRDWNATEQVNCGADHGEFACFWFDEMHRKWDYQGLNEETKLVREAQVSSAFETEMRLLRGKTLATSPDQATPMVVN